MLFIFFIVSFERGIGNEWMYVRGFSPKKLFFLVDYPLRLDINLDKEKRFFFLYFFMDSLCSIFVQILVEFGLFMLGFLRNSSL